MRVLIVDDSAVMRMILERGLRQAGFGPVEVHHAANGATALTRMEEVEARGETFDLVLTDVHMPVMNGPELLDEARRRGLAQGVPVVMISAEDGSGLPEERAFNRLTKPFTLEQMRASLGPLLAAGAHR